MFTLLALPLSFAQSVEQGEFLPPARSLAGDDGAGAAWVNPANMGFQPYPELGLWFQQELATLGPSGFAISTSSGGTGLTLAQQYDSTTDEPWWTLGSAVSIGSDSLRLGANIEWNLPTGGLENFVAWDIGLGYRPLPYLGFAAVSRNLGAPEDLGLLQFEPGYEVGMLVRPFSDILELGVEYHSNYTSPLLSAPAFAGSVALRPMEGLDLRVRVNSQGAIDGGLMLAFGGGGVGGFYQQAETGEMAATGHLRATTSDERLLGLGRQVPLFDMGKSYPYQSQASFFSAPSETYMQLLQRINRSIEDRSVKALVLDMGGASFSLAQIMELQGRLQAFQETERPIIAYLDGGAGNGSYMLAAGCDHVFLHPAGGLDIIGLFSERTYLRGTLDKFGIVPDFTKRSEFKSAPERFTNTESSDAARKQTQALLDDLYQTWIQSMTVSRDLSEEEIKALVDGAPYTPEEAVAKGLVDGLLYPDELSDKVEEVLDMSVDIEEEYAVNVSSTGWQPTKEIALIYIEGAIMPGESSQGLLGGGGTGADTIARALHEAKDRDAVKAVVLRVDSPGGSAFASDVIWRAIEEVKAEGKPVIVSMGSVAASGGYYVAAGADAIFAEPATVTGSIGVYSTFFSLQGLYEKLGVTTESYTRGRNAGMYSLSKPRDASEQEAVDRMIDHTYAQFKTRVGDGRGLTPEQVEELARGRVWSGLRAVEIGLVDELGGIQEAIERARVEAEVRPREEVTLVGFRAGSSAGLPLLRVGSSLDALGISLFEDLQVALRAQVDPDNPLARAAAEWATLEALSEDPYLMMMPEVLDIQAP